MCFPNPIKEKNMVEWAYISQNPIEEPVSLIWDDNDLVLANKDNGYAVARQELIPASLRHI